MKAILNNKKIFGNVPQILFEIAQENEIVNDYDEFEPILNNYILGNFPMKCWKDNIINIDYIKENPEILEEMI